MYIYNLIKMKKILIISFYDLKDYLLYIKNVFEQYKFSVIEYQLFRYAYDSNDKIPNYKEHMNEFIKQHEPHVILWWFIDVPIDVFKYIKNHHMNKLFIMYNSDDPINLNNELFDKAKLFDIVITPCKETIHLYKMFSNVKTVLFGPMGFDPNLFMPITNINEFKNEYNEFSSDISMLTYNLFFDKTHYPSQVVYKKSMIDNVINYCNENNYTFKLYGTPVLKELYPSHYSGEVPYYKMNFLFNFSKINIISSPDKTKSMHINEYTMPILGAGGLLMYDKIKDIEKIYTNDEPGFLVYDSNNYINIIDNVLNNYDSYVSIKKSGRLLSERYTWDNWVKNIVIEIGKIFFDKKVYTDLYDLDKNKSDNELLDYWCSEGINSGHVCFDFDIPENFNSHDYIEKYSIKNNDKYAYIHWITHSKNDLYLKRSSKINNDFIPSNYNIVMEDYYNVSTILNKVSNYTTRDKGLLELDHYCKQIPYIKINDILNHYINSI